MEIVNNYKAVMRNYIGFAGRAGRAEYWLFFLAVFLINAIAMTVDAAIGLGLLAPIVSLVHFLPSLAVASRRLHDTNRSAWWLLLLLVPLVGFIVLIVFLVQRGTPGDNLYGAPPAPAA